MVLNAPAGKEKSTKVKFPALDFLWNAKTVWKEMQPTPLGSMLWISRLWTKPLPISVILGKQGDKDFGSSAMITACLESSLSSTLKAPLSADPFSGLHTSSKTTGSQMYFQWSLGCLSTFLGGHHISIVKNGDKEGSLGQNQVCVFICWKPLPSSIYGGQEAWVRGNEAASESQEQRAPKELFLV